MEISAPPRLDLSLYPATYRVSSGYAIFLSLLSVISVTAGGLGAWYFGTGHETHSVREATTLAVLSFLFVLLGAFLIISLLRTQLTLTSDSVVMQETVSSRTLLRSEIAGRRFIPTQYFSTLVLVPRSRHKKRMKVALIFRTDAAFDAWVADLPDLDAQEVTQSEADLAVDPDLGFHSDSRKERVAGARKIARALTIAACVPSFLGFFFPHPYALVVLALVVFPLVVIAVLVRSDGIYQMEGRRNDARPSLAAAFLFPCLALGLRGVQDLHLIRWTPIISLAILTSILLSVILYQSDRGMRQRPWSLLPIVLFGSFYAYGAIGEADALLDHSASQTFTVAVNGKHVSHGKTTSYYLQLASWGPQQDPSSVTVPSDLYDAVAIGESVCISLHPGALHIPWYEIDTCR